MNAAAQPSLRVAGTDDVADAGKAAALTSLLADARARRTVSAAQQCLDPDIVDLLKRAGVYRALVAKRFGGDEQTPSDFLRLVERIAQADGSTGWVASFGASAAFLSPLPLTTLEAIYADGPDVVFAGGVFPPQGAVRVPGGFEISGRWSWGSGCTGADIVGVGVKVAGEVDGPLRTAVMPAHRATIVPNWDVNGLKGTGSHDIVVDRVVVPEDWTFPRGGDSSLDTPLYRYPAMVLAAQVLAVVGLGVARGALDTIIEIAGGRTSITGAPVLADRAHVQSGVAKAEAALRSAAAFFYETTDAAFATAVAGDVVGMEAKTLLRLASSHAARVGAEVAQSVYMMAGTTGIFTAHPIAQALQDALVVPQHAFLAEGTYQSAGRILLGMEPAPGFP